jgi:P pilus assembly chaperone PapD
MENKMKKLIALFATTAVASTSAMGAIALSGTASVAYDDNGSKILQHHTTLTCQLLVLLVQRH